MSKLKIVRPADVRRWLADGGLAPDRLASIGRKRLSSAFLEDELGVPPHLRFVSEQLAAEAEEAGEEPPSTAEALASIPFYSLCRGLFLPLAMMAPEKAAQVFGVAIDDPPDAKGREALLARFLEAEVGLSTQEKIACILGDPFIGRASTFRRERLLRLLSTIELRSRAEQLDALTRVGDVAVLYAEARDELKGAPPLTAGEVLRTLRYLPDIPLRERLEHVRALLLRCGKLEAYFLAKLLLRKAGFGFEYQGALLGRVLGERFGAPPEAVDHAMSLTDPFHVAEVLEREGPEGLRKVRLQPLVPLRPCLAGGNAEDVSRFPVWVEKKYDGVRFMLHKHTDARGAVLCGAYTRNRRDWLELVPGLRQTITMLPGRSWVLDGELYGTVMDLDGARPATVYEVHGSLGGAPERPVSLRFAAFDLLYYDGQELTAQVLQLRQQWLQRMLAPVAMLPLPIPIVMAEGQLAQSKADLNRLFGHFRAQGYEGIITKELDSPYMLATRDKRWGKRKPQITLDLVLQAASFAVTTKQHAGVFGSYIIGARDPQGGFATVGDVAGVDQLRDREIQQLIMRDGLLTGRRIEVASASGARPGVELRPSIVVTVKFEGIVHDKLTGRLSLRDPKIALIRPDKPANEADSIQALEELYVRQRLG